MEAGLRQKDEETGSEGTEGRTHKICMQYGFGAEQGGDARGEPSERGGDDLPLQADREALMLYSP